MIQVEHAIYTSARTARAEGYQLAARSPGVDDADAQELASWGPSHDSLLDTAPGDESINFHRLASGRFCLSRTSAAGREYSGRRGPRIYTQCLLVEPDGLARFANNPFSLLKAATAHGQMEIRDEIPRQLDAFSLSGRSAVVDRELLARLSVAPGVQALAATMQAALATDSLGITTTADRRGIVEGLFNCLPTSCRTEFSFSTGLKFSPRRPFRVFFIPDDRQLLKRMDRNFGITPLELDGGRLDRFDGSVGWARLVCCGVRPDRIANFASLLEQLGDDVDSSQLTALADTLMWQLESPTRQSVATDDVTSASSGRQQIEALTASLYRDPFSETIWRQWSAAHDACLQAGDREGAGELVRRACQVFSAHADGRTQLADRVAELLQQQIAVDAATFRNTVERLRGLAAFDGREMWLRVAGRVEDCPRRPAANNPGQQEAKSATMDALAEVLPSAVAGNTEALAAARQLWQEAQERLQAGSLDALREESLKRTVSAWHACAAVEDRDAASLRTLDLVSMLLDVTSMP